MILLLMVGPIVWAASMTRGVGGGNRVANMRVVFRADATPSIGAGHVMRCWALAEEFAAREWEIAWQGSIEVPWLAAALSGAGWSVSGPGPIEADLVVVDSYTLGPDWRQRLLDRGIPVVAVVDSHHQELGPGTLWVNPGPPMAMPSSRSFLNGPTYVLIRSKIRALRALRESSDARDGVTVLLGGTDFAGIGALVDQLELSGSVYAGPGTGSGGGVTWLPGGPELLRRASCSRLVVSAAGVSSWEMLHVGVPLALVMAAENQRGNYDWMTSQGWAIGLGQGPDLAQRLPEVVSEPPAGVSRIDGLGAQRVVDAALEVC
jgi:spore coat polysaccharide biosynthesis predicted glycosyltransferase SpsG